MKRWRRSWGRGVGVALLCLACVVVSGVEGMAGITSLDREETFSPVKVSHDVEIVGAELGEFRFDEKANAYLFYRQDRFDRTSKHSYGWRLELRTRTQRRIEFKEIFTLPAAPKQWGISDAVELSADRKRATTRLYVTPDASGYVSNYWSFSEGDPTGAHHFEIWVEGHYVTRLDFEVD